VLASAKGAVEKVLASFRKVLTSWKELLKKCWQAKKYVGKLRELLVFTEGAVKKCYQD